MRLKNKAVFVTGTDTGIGKTEVSLLLMEALKAHDLKVGGMKPVASGCKQTGGRLRNEDALRLQQSSSIQAEYSLVNPFSYEPAISPNIAAELSARPVDLRLIEDAFRKLERSSDFIVVEGVGGWRCPFSRTESAKDLVLKLQIPVILVVAIRLGCISHAVLTADALHNDGLPVLGWVANDLGENCENRKEIINTLGELLNIPLIADVPCLKEKGVSDKVFDLNQILG